MKKRLALVALAITAAPAAHAHPGHPGHGSGFEAGLAHPLLGTDHLLAMVAIGLFAAQLGGRALWAVPSAFVAGMILSAIAAVGGLTLPLLEPAIFVSVVLLGILVALAARLPLAVAIGFAAFFGIFHGAAHGLEMPFSASLAAYGSGFVLSTAALHLAGIGLGMLLQRWASASFVRYAGAAIAVAGVVIAAQIF